MTNMLDYLAWRGDLPLTSVPLGEVDALILAQLAMLRWERSGMEGGTLRELSKAMAGIPVSDSFTAGNDRKMLAAVGESERFGHILLGDYVHEVDQQAVMQFAAITLHLPDGSHYVSFRGTDASIVGWEEDCAMAFSEPVPAQNAAARYLADIAGRYSGPLYIGGHSKGGNLAMFASTEAEEEIRSRMKTVFNFDGPGLSDQVDAQALYARISGRLRSFVPQGSVVGLLLAHPDQYTVVKSASVSVFQHDPYTWQVKGPRFIAMPSLSANSQRFDIFFRRWLAGVGEKDRMILVKTLFGILAETKSKSFGRAFWIALAQNRMAVLRAISQVDPENRRRVLKMIADLGRLALKATEENTLPSQTAALTDPQEEE